MTRQTVLSIIGSAMLLSGVVFVAAKREGPSLGAADDHRGQPRSIEQRIDVNTASVHVLSRLPGVGPELAERIVQHRPYKKLDELITKKVLGRKQFARIKDRIRIGPTLVGSAVRSTIIND
ncbi:MAG: ComEA family DNA-binding protein [Candidatus Methylomirabilaceae bacterium]